MKQPQRHLHVAALTCPHCQEKQDDIERRDGIIRTLQLELNRAMEDLAAQTEVSRAAGRATVAAKGWRTKQAKAEARLEQIEEVVAHWREHRPRTGPEFGEPGTKSFDIIEKALILMEKDPAGPAAACKEAIDGLHIAPWEAFGVWYAKPGPKRKLRNTIDYALGDEQKIERRRAAVRLARSEPERMLALWRTLCETERALSAAIFSEIGTQREPDEPRFEVDGVVTRSDG